MNLALEHYTQNPIIDELYYLPHKTNKIKTVRACVSMFRRPFIEVEMAGGEDFLLHFVRDSFGHYWAEAVVILETLTDIEVNAEFKFEPLRNRETFIAELLATREDCIAEADQMFAEGMYLQYLNQFGLECKNLPAETQQKVAEARRNLASG